MLDWRIGAAVAVARPITAGFHPERETYAVEPRLAAIKRIGVADRLAHYWKIEGLPARHRREPASTAPNASPRPMISRQKHGMVEFEEPAQIWHVGVETFRIGSTYLGRTRIVDQSRPVMQSLMTETGKTANLAIVDRGEVVFVSQVETHEPIRAFFRPGRGGRSMPRVSARR